MKIIELELRSADIHSTEVFYRKNMGLTAAMVSSDELIFNVGTTKLIFSKQKDLKPVYHFAFDVPNNRFEEAYNSISSKISLLPVGNNLIADFKNWDARSFYFLDNNGNIVEIITRYKGYKSIVPI